MKQKVHYYPGASVIWKPTKENRVRGLNSFEFVRMTKLAIPFDRFLLRKHEDEKEKVMVSDFKDWKSHGFNENAYIPNPSVPKSYGKPMVNTDEELAMWRAQNK